MLAVECLDANVVQDMMSGGLDAMARDLTRRVVDHLAKMGRDPFVVTEDDRAALVARAVALHASGVRGAALWVGTSSTWRARVAERMRAGTAAPAVSAAWAARKARLGYPTTPSVASAQLVRAIQGAALRVRRTR